MPERELDLIQSRPSFVGKLGKRSAEIMGCQVANAEGCRILRHSLATVFRTSSIAWRGSCWRKIRGTEKPM